LQPSSVSRSLPLARLQLVVEAGAVDLSGEAGAVLSGVVDAVLLGAVDAVLLGVGSEVPASAAARSEVAEAGVGDTLVSDWDWVSVLSALAITTVAIRTTGTAVVGSALSSTAHMGQSSAASGSATDLLHAAALSSAR
jgi:hypothetical protein